MSRAAGFLAAVVMVTVGIVGCTPSHHSPAPSGPHSGQSPTSRVTAPTVAPTSTSAGVPARVDDGGVPLVSPPCYVPLPHAWAASKRDGLLWSGIWDQHPTQAPTPEATGVLLQTDSGTQARMVFAGPGHRTVEKIGTIPNPTRTGVVGFNAVSADYAAFVFHRSNSGGDASARWSLYLWDRHRRVLTRVATDPTGTDGQPLRSGYVQPKLTDRYLYWIQAAPDTTGWDGGSELVQYTLASGHTRVLYQGLTEAFVPYGHLVLYTAIVAGTPPRSPTDTDGPPERLYAVDAATGRPAPAPAGITAAADHPNYFISSGDLVLWATNEVIRAWRPAWQRSITLVPSEVTWSEGRHLEISGPTYPRLYGHFLVWNAGATYVLDLTTDSFAALDTIQVAAGEDMSGSVLSMQEYTHPTGNVTASRYQWNQYLFDLRGQPHLPTCGQ